MNRLSRMIGIIAVVVCFGIINLQAEEMSLFSVPPHIVPKVAPNILISFDNSPSMFRGFSPDSLGTKGQYALRAVKSSHYNVMYYDPSIDYLPPKDAFGNDLPSADFLNSYNNNYLNATQKRLASTAGIDLSGEYNPRWSEDGLGLHPRYAPDESDAYRDGAAYYYRFDVALNPAACVGAEEEKSLNNACYRFVPVTEISGDMRSRPELGGQLSRDERVNFANWYQYYSLKILASKAISSYLFSPEKLSSVVRVAYQSMDAMQSRSGSETKAPNALQRLSESERANLFQWFYSLEVANDRHVSGLFESAGEFFRGSGSQSVYRERPWDRKDSGQEVSCRANYHVLISDGQSNYQTLQSADYPDHKTTLLPDGTVYQPQEQLLFADAQQSTLADLAFTYWAQDLREDLPNDVRFSMRHSASELSDSDSAYWHYQNDPASWQHMANYIISPGASGLVPIDESVFQSMARGEAFSNQRGDRQNGWTELAVENGPDTSLGRVDDLLHAAINSRGGFYHREQFGRLRETGLPVMDLQREYSSSVLNTSSFSTGDVLYQAQFNTQENSGHLLALSSVAATQVDQQSAAYWDAMEVNQSLRSSERLVASYDPAKELGRRGIQFQWMTDGLNLEQQRILDRDGLGEKRVRYIRGERAQEQQFGGPFRDRQSASLGPIINSTPLLVGNGFSPQGAWQLRYPDDMESGGQSHSEFICSSPHDSNQDGLIESCDAGIYQRLPLVYIGSNDGMLHAYDADPLTGGRELFSYVPNALISRLSQLTARQTAPIAMVDGVLNAADVFYGGQWHTMLVGGLRTGGQAYFGLDITEPGNFRSDRFSKVVRWEFSDRDDPDLGFSFSKPVIVKSNYQSSGSNGRWVVIFGNGYNATQNDGQVGSGQAVLFVVDIETGKLLRKITTGMGDRLNPNGLATPAAVYNNADYKADYVYAGDLRGNLWKFDISSDNPSDWRVANGRSLSDRAGPLFTARVDGVVQPITAAPVVGGHPAGLGGLMVYFGTGQYLEYGDQSDASVQSVYAIWDKNQCRENRQTVPCEQLQAPLMHVPSSVDRADLLAQYISAQQGNRRSVSERSIDWDEHQGWVLDLNHEQGEKIIAQPILLGPLLFINSIVPSEDACKSGGDSWLMALDRTTGGRTRSQTFDHNGDGEFDRHDSIGGLSTAGLKRSITSNDVISVACDGGLCIDADGLIKVSEGIRWGRWRWKVLQE